MAGSIVRRVSGLLRRGCIFVMTFLEVAHLEVDVNRTAVCWTMIAPTLFMLVVINQLDKTNSAVIMADRSVLSEMGLSGQPARIGSLSTIFFLGYGLGLLAWGFVVDRLGPRRSAVLGVCGGALPTLGGALAGRFTTLAFACFELGGTYAPS